MSRALLIIIIISITGLIAVSLIFRADTKTPDAVAIHYAMHMSMERGTAREAAIMQTEFLMQAFEEMDTARRNRDNNLRIFMYLFILVFVVGGVLLYIYLYKRIIKPFQRLQYFAGRVAAGNLDIPLEMDRHNLFGAFSESFDLMRDELRLAKENENKANKSKKELVASLVHDITTPVASVRSAIDILRLKTGDAAEINILDSANKKLEQIDTLVTNMFHATLEELQELKVMPSEQQSTGLYELIQQADYEKRARPFSIPDCIIQADPLRLQQVFDNIIKNSYKYASTDISINSFIEEEHLFIEIRDFGLGVSEKELPLITGKFYRGANTGKIDGYGLGLYLSKYFMEQMSGGLYPENYDEGFMVVIMLRLAGV